MSEELKACPFCGGKGRVKTGSSSFWVVCEAGCNEDVFRYKDTAIHSWNTRADGWVSVDERIPNYKDKFYLIADHDGHIDTCYYDAGVWSAWGVSHWMELPKPPTKKGD